MSSGCDPAISNFCQYDRKIVTGFIVQVFYPLTNVTELKLADAILIQISKKCGGLLTGENGIFKNRRDVDFIFQTIESANIFKHELNNNMHSSFKFYVHDKLNKNGILKDLPSLEEISSLETTLIQTIC